ncbi:MAG: WHG domain-containing protein [Microcella sp.]|uniref:TetR/AcrR family transcriptional regulator n=1 Tax=Microcella sp. TaxID=1913979 RepID=UPI0033155E53
MTNPPRSPDLRSRLLDAGLELLRNAGVSAVTMRAVAARADVSHAAPGYVFGDRAGLLTAMAERGFDELTAHLSGRGDGPEAGTINSMVEVGMRYLDFERREPEIYRLLFDTPEIRRAEPGVATAGAAAFGVLTRAVPPGIVSPAYGLAPVLAWAVVHGLASLGRTGALDRQFEQTVGRDAAQHALLTWIAHAVTPAPTD